MISCELEYILTEKTREKKVGKKKKRRQGFFFCFGFEPNAKTTEDQYREKKKSIQLSAQLYKQHDRSLQIGIWTQMTKKKKNIKKRMDHGGQCKS